MESIFAIVPIACLLYITISAATDALHSSEFVIHVNKYIHFTTVELIYSQADRVPTHGHSSLCRTPSWQSRSSFTVAGAAAIQNNIEGKLKEGGRSYNDHV